MERTRVIKLPIAGNIQHGKKQDNGLPKQLGYFMAKTNDSQMDLLIKKFEKIYGEKPTKLRIRFFSENPLTVKNVRYTQINGIVCYCNEGEKIGKEKVNDKWQDKECLPTCEYSISIAGQKPSCTQEGTLKFLLPEISLDRAWLLKIRGITVIDKIRDYIESQKLFGNSIVGDFILYLTKEKQTRKSDGKTFTNYMLGILKDEENANVDALKQEKTEMFSTNCDETVEKSIIEEPKETNKKSETTRVSTKKSTKENKTTKKQNVEETKVVPIQSNENETTKEDESDPENCYCFVNIEPIVIKNKGKEIEYAQGIFMDIDGNQFSAIVNKELASELAECDIGTTLELELKEINERRWVMKSKFTQKCPKKVAV